jgi:hypothetical protein
MNKAITFLLLCHVCLTAQCQESAKEENFPKSDEIQLVLSQSERAFEQYDRSIKLEAGLPSALEDSSMLEKDRQIVNLAGRLISGLKRNPDAFHGVGGLLLLGALDDASRNAALCFGTAFADIGNGLLAAKGLDRAKAYELMHIGQACQDVSVQLYTISENVHALMVRELEGQQILSGKAVDALNQCVAVVKNGKASQK